MIVTGAGGKLGRLLRAAWREEANATLCPIWTGRDKDVEVQWDIATGSVPSLPFGAVVLHLAGTTRGTADELQRNIAMVPQLLQACRDIRARTLLFVSTAAVYAPGPLPAKENDPPLPAGAYGRSKLAAERLVLAQTDVPVTILRLGNVAGADALLGPRPFPSEIVLDPVPGRDGGPVRSWIGARQLALVLGRLCSDPVIGSLPAILNVAADPPLAMGDLLNASGLPWRYGTLNPDVVPDAVMNTQRLHGIMQLPTASASDLAAEAAWAREVLA